jgi:DNA replication factor GINS
MGSGSTTDTSPTPPEESGPGTSGTPGETGSQTPPEPPEPEPEVRNDGGATAADTDAGATTADENAGVERETVRITADVGDFLGIDEREYDLSENDVVTLPATNVEPLVSRDAAERLD